MHYFRYKGKDLYGEDAAIGDIVNATGTPVYIYSSKTLKRHLNAFKRAFSGTRHLICYSVKANSNVSILKAFSRLGAGFDIVSAGELYRAMKAGGDPGRIVFSGVGKRHDEIEYALKTDILMFNVESGEELRLLDSIAGRLKKKARFAIRVNPNVDAKTHPYVSTGLKKNKFGVEEHEAKREYVFAKNNLKNLSPVGIDCHIGSQITSIAPFIDALKKTRALLRDLRNEGIGIKYIDMGGGLGITYDKEAPPHPTRYGKEIIKATKGLDATLIFEPGRSIVGNAGILVTRVLYNKKGTLKNFIVVDAGMNDLARPSLYGSYHAIKPVKMNGGEEITADIVGPVCESGDFLAKDRLIERPSPGDCLAVMSAGAYGFSMSSNYNSRPRPAEVMVNGRKFSVIRKREGLKDLVRGEAL